MADSVEVKLFWMPLATAAKQKPAKSPLAMKLFAVHTIAAARNNVGPHDGESAHVVGRGFIKPAMADPEMKLRRIFIWDKN